MQLFDTYYQNAFDKLIDSDFWLFELSVWLHVFARSLIAVFVPVILLLIGFSLSEVLLYYLAYHIIDVPFTFLARRFVRAYGARMAIIIANVAIIAFFILLAELSLGAWHVLAVMAVLAALYDALFWIAHLYLFIESRGTKKVSSKETSILYIVKRIAGFAAPLIGALVIIFASEKVLIVAAISVFAVSIIPLLYAKGLPDKPKGRSLSFKEFFDDRRERVNYLSFTTFTLHRFNEKFLWPLFVFLIIGTIEAVAFVPVMVALAAIFFTYVAGKIDACNYSRTIIVSSVALILMWLLRFHFENELFLFASVFIIGVFSVFIDLPLDSNIFARGKIVDPLSAVMWRNVLSMGVRVPILFVLLISVHVFEISFSVAVIGLTALALIQIILISVYRNPLCKM